ncbi:unnamed protein product, partial [Discosporangium mesarthrocarpum]
KNYGAKKGLSSSSGVTGFRRGNNATVKPTCSPPPQRLPTTIPQPPAAKQGPTCTSPDVSANPALHLQSVHRVGPEEKEEEEQEGCGGKTKANINEKEEDVEEDKGGDEGEEDQGEDMGEEEDMNTLV